MPSEPKWRSAGQIVGVAHVEKTATGEITGALKRRDDPETDGAAADRYASTAKSNPRHEALTVPLQQERDECEGRWPHRASTRGHPRQSCADQPPLAAPAEAGSSTAPASGAVVG